LISARIGRASVLLADDHEEFLAAVVRHLEPHFEIVRTVGNGQMLLDEAARRTPDVIVLDISMPDMNGLEVARALHDSGSKAAVVFLTVQNEEEIIHAASATGALGYVAKPRLISDLMFAVREARAGRTFHSPAR